MSNLEDNLGEVPTALDCYPSTRHSLDPLHELIEPGPEVPANRKSPGVQILRCTVGLTRIGEHAIDQHSADLPQLGVREMDLLGTPAGGVGRGHELGQPPRTKWRVALYPARYSSGKGGPARERAPSIGSSDPTPPGANPPK